MNTHHKQLRDAVKKIGLTERERDHLRSVLLQEMSEHPIPATYASSVSSEGRARHHKYRTKFNKHSFRKTMPITLLIALLLGGSVSYAAEGTVPGDTLYPIKIHVNENVRSTLAITNAAEARLEVDLAERRLNEAEKLEHGARLDSETKVKLKKKFDDHRARADLHIKDVEQDDREDAVRIHDDFEVRLRGHSKTLELLEVELNDQQGDRKEDDDDHGRGKNNQSEGSADDSKLRGSSKAKTEIIIKKREGKREIKLEAKSEAQSSFDDDRDEHEGDDDEDEDADEGQDGQGVLSVMQNPVTILPTPRPVATTPTSVGTTLKTYTMAQVALHNNAASCFTHIAGGVYDVTSFISAHPGGTSAITVICGRDGTAFFEAQHGGASKPENMLASLKVGIIANP